MINYGLTCYSFPETVTVAINAKSSSVGTGKLLFFFPLLLKIINNNYSIIGEDGCIEQDNQMTIQ